MKLTVHLFGAAALVFAAMPAQAASDAFLTGAEAYEAGKASETRPQEQNEIAYCAGFWNVWGDALADEVVSEDDLAVLSPVLQPLSAPFQALGLFSKLQESDTLDAEVEEGRIEARRFLEETLAGDEIGAASLFGTLGACSI